MNTSCSTQSHLFKSQDDVGRFHQIMETIKKVIKNNQEGDKELLGLGNCSQIEYFGDKKLSNLGNCIKIEYFLNSQFYFLFNSDEVWWSYNQHCNCIDIVEDF